MHTAFCELNTLSILTGYYCNLHTWMIKWLEILRIPFCLGLPLWERDSIRKVNDIRSRTLRHPVVLFHVHEIDCNGYSPLYFTHVTSSPSTDLPLPLSSYVWPPLYKLDRIKKEHGCECADDTRHHHAERHRESLSHFRHRDQSRIGRIKSRDELGERRVRTQLEWDESGSDPHRHHFRRRHSQYKSGNFESINEEEDDWK